MARVKKTTKAKDDSQPVKDDKPSRSGKAGEVGKKGDKTEKGGDDQGPDVMRILFRGRCAKLTPRGVGELEYEIGISEKTGEASIRVVKNESSGAFSTIWVAVADMWKILDGIKENPFKAVVFRELYLKKSSNNHGFLGAVLKAEGVIEALPNQPAALVFKDWKGLLEKVDKLNKDKVSLPDLLAGGKGQKIVEGGKTDE